MEIFWESNLATLMLFLAANKDISYSMAYLSDREILETARGF